MSAHETQQAATAFSLRSIFLAVTGMGVCFALARVSPALAILVLVGFSGALIRTLAWVHMRREEGRKLTFDQKFRFFCGSVVVMVYTPFAALPGAFLAGVLLLPVVGLEYVLGTVACLAVYLLGTVVGACIAVVGFLKGTWQADKQNLDY